MGRVIDKSDHMESTGVELMKIFSARHGETEWNRLNKICGRTDIPLTEKGIAQAEAMAEKIKNQEIHLIFASPMIRAVQTAQAAAKACGVEIIIDERLIEQDYGIYEGMDRRSEAFLDNKRNFAYRYPGGESMMQVAARVYSFIDEIKEKYKDKNILLVSHGGVCRVINTYFCDVTNEEYFNFCQPNAEAIEYELQELRVN